MYVCGCDGTCSCVYVYIYICLILVLGLVLLYEKQYHICYYNRYAKFNIIFSDELQKIKTHYFNCSIRKREYNRIIFGQAQLGEQYTVFLHKY